MIEITKIKVADLMVCVPSEEIREQAKSAIVEALKLAHPVRLVRYWHSNSQVDLVGYDGMPAETAREWAEKLGWLKRPCQRVKKIDEIVALNESYSVSEHAYHNALEVVRFSDENAYEPMMIDACAWCDGV